MNKLRTNAILSPTLLNRCGGSPPQSTLGGAMSQTGYYRQPTIHKNQVVFVCDDDLWTVESSGGIARRLSKGQGECLYPRFSPDGKQIAFICLEEGHPELFVVNADGSALKRLTYLGGEQTFVLCWSLDGKNVLISCDARTPFFRHAEILSVDAQSGEIQPLNHGHALYFTIDQKGRKVIGRNNLDPAMWKRYRGGKAGRLWIDRDGKGQFSRFHNLNGNIVSPMLIDDRAYFLSDHEGIGNIYSSKLDESDLVRHTQHSEYFVRFPSTDGERIIYGAAGNLFILDCKTNETTQIDIQAPSQEQHSARKFSNAADHIEDLSISPAGNKIAFTTRGQAFSMPFFEGACVQHSPGSEVRYREINWLHEGEKFIAISDSGAFERIVLHDAADPLSPAQCLTDAEIGRIVELSVSPDGTRIAFSNHRFELAMLDMKSKKITIIDRSNAERISGLSWSPDSRWLAYACFPQYTNLSIIKIADADSGKTHEATRPIRIDYDPCFDPSGKYLYFLSNREFKPIYDSMQFELSFPRSVRPYAIILSKATASPLAPNEKPYLSQADEKPTATDTEKPGEKSEDKVVQIDFDGIHDRILSIPVEEGLYGNLKASNDRIIFLAAQLKGIPREFSWHGEETTYSLIAYDFNEKKEGVLVNALNSYFIGADRKTIVARLKDKFKVLDATQPLDKPADLNEHTLSRATGMFDLSRCNLLVEPRKEWAQMYREAWRLQQEHFWDEKMSDVDWNLVHERYALVLPKVRTRSELSDLIWEMQGELGTSHAYEFGGDRPSPRPYYKGFLGCDLVWDEKNSGYRISKILRGDSWDPDANSPLAEPGIGIEEGDLILAVNGKRVSKNLSVDELLLKAGGQYIQLGIRNGMTNRTVTVKAMTSERYLRYRNWVETNREIVHKASNGKLGYIHIPDMGPPGFAEFHRSYLSEFNYEGLVVDVRYNRGGHVSGLLLQKLLRKRLGYDVPRYGHPQPYPNESPVGPMVAVTNQFAGSDGDIFSHCFKLNKLGPLVGHRTWGGVIGIHPRHNLVDGTLTTQPEYSFWFEDVGWSVENYGTDPDYPVDYRPQDYNAGVDPQLEKAIELAMEEVKKAAFKLPDFNTRPRLPLPTVLKK